MKKCILINSPIFWDAAAEGENYLSPLGLGYIATYVEKAGIQVEILDAVKQRKSVEDIVKYIEEKQPDYVGINIFTQNYKLVKAICEQTKVKCEWFIGGPVVGSIYEEIVKWNLKNRMNIIIGDGEYIIPTIILDNKKVEPIKKIENINKRFADAKTEKEKDALRKEGRELNLKLHEAFKYIQDHFIGIELSSTITTSFAQYQENIELFNDIIQALEKGNISNDKDGALDLAWHINGGSEYGFYDFSVESNLRAQRRLSEETNPNNVFWTTNRQFKFAKTYPALLGIFEKAEQENPDFADEINIYQEEIKKLQQKL